MSWRPANPIGRRIGLDLTALALVAVAAMLAMQMALAVTRQINWDEFYFLSHIYAYRNGTLATPLQHFHVHLFGWLMMVPGGEIGQIVAGRLAMLGLEVVTLWSLYTIASRFADREAAALAIVAYLSVPFVLLHGTAFRADPVATCLLMSSLALIVAGGLNVLKACLAGLAVALAGLVTIKSVFLVPVILAAGLWRLGPRQTRRARLVPLASGAVVSVIAFAVLYKLHADSIAGASPGEGLVAVDKTVGKVFDPHALLRTGFYLAAAVKMNPLPFLALLTGIAAAVYGALTRPDARARLLIVLICAFPAVTLLFYRNSFPYYYVFALAPATVPMAVAIGICASSGIRRAGLAVLFALAAVTAYAGASPQHAQRTTLAAVHALFPDPVAYIDRCSMVASFPESGFFMSTWGIENYRAAGQPVLRDAIVRTAPRFVLANSPLLREALMPGTEDLPEPYRLMATDAAALRANYIHYWGPIWLAGKRIDALGIGTAMPVSILVPGLYTLTSDFPVEVDGRVVQPGAALTLSRGWHRLRSASGTQSVTLRWGQSLPELPPAPDGPMFAGF